MSVKTITIESNTSKRGKLDVQSFPCRILDDEEDRKRFYILKVTKRILQQKRFNLTPGCRIIDNNSVYLIQDISYWPRPYYPILTVDLDAPTTSCTSKGEPENE